MNEEAEVERGALETGLFWTFRKIFTSDVRLVTIKRIFESKNPIGIVRRIKAFCGSSR
jgi:hypothetical protein